ncbi:MAG: hypothetical protein HY270_05550 [Deltaproteobacteria bacterium]|nr:hypothetical protein [Deltaproteobacteria bacterium]
MAKSDEAILSTVTHKVRLLSFPQIVRTWWPHVRTPSSPRSAITGLVRGGWLTQIAVKAHPELPLTEPVLAWRPRDPTPNFSALAHHVRKRFGDAVEQTTVYLATPLAARTLGGFAGKLKRDSVTHDIHLGGLYVRLLRNNPEEASLWISEDELAPEREDQVLPDAILRKPDGTLLRVVEFCGSSYTADRLSHIHFDCLARDVPYEFW